MNTTKLLLLASTVAASVLASACSAESADDTNAPTASVDGLDTLDEGTSYNGWSQSVQAIVYTTMGISSLNHTLTRSYGDATRGGGACFLNITPNGCSDDSTCLATAQAQYGSSAWGYCYSGRCYTRPGSQANYCTMSPNRSAGTIAGQWFTSYNVSHAVGCMTKSAGPNTACGGTNAALYMRTMATATWNTQSP